MTGAKSAEHKTGVRLLCLLLAGLLWLGVVLERPGEMKLQVPVVLEHLPAGLLLASPPPGNLEITVSGPRILLPALLLRPSGCRLDLTRAGAGPVGYNPLEGSFGLDRELKVKRAYPAVIRVTLARHAER